MAGALNVVAGDTAPSFIQYKTGSVPVDITGDSAICRVATDPITDLVVTITDPTNGEGTIIPGTLPAGTYLAEIKTTSGGLVKTSEQFTINVRESL